jgi:hypothetical protein
MFPEESSIRSRPFRASQSREERAEPIARRRGGALPDLAQMTLPNNLAKAPATYDTPRKA